MQTTYIQKNAGIFTLLKESPSPISRAPLSDTHQHSFPSSLPASHALLITRIDIPMHFASTVWSTGLCIGSRDVTRSNPTDHTSTPRTCARMNTTYDRWQNYVFLCVYADVNGCDGTSSLLSYLRSPLRRVEHASAKREHLLRR